MSERAIASRCLWPPERILGILLKHCIETTRQTLNKLVGARKSRSLSHFLKGRIGLNARDIVTHGAAKQKILLQYEAYALPKMD